MYKQYLCREKLTRCMWNCVLLFSAVKQWTLLESELIQASQWTLVFISTEILQASAQWLHAFKNIRKWGVWFERPWPKGKKGNCNAAKKVVDEDAEVQKAERMKGRVDLSVPSTYRVFSMSLLWLFPFLHSCLEVLHHAGDLVHLLCVSKQLSGWLQF